MTNEDLEQIKQILKEAFVENNKNLVTKDDLVQNNKNLVTKDDLTQNNKKLEKIIDEKVDNLAMITNQGFDELKREFKNDISIVKIELENKIENVAKEAKKNQAEVLGWLEKEANEVQNAKTYQAINIGEHDKIKDNHNQLKVKVNTHNARIDALETA